VQFKVRVRIIENKKARYCLYAYARACILNRSERSLLFYNKKLVGMEQIDEKALENSEIIIMPSTKRIKIGLDNHHLSKKLSIGIKCG